MSLPITRKSTDHSCKEEFSFSFFCDCCGSKWTSRSISFMAGGFSKIEHEEARQIIWACERKSAFEHANLDAHAKFNRCKKCGRWVCDECFEMDYGICRECC